MNKQLRIFESHTVETADKDVNESDPLHNDQLPVGFFAQLVEHCTCISEVVGSNPVQAWIFLSPYFNYC